MNTRANDRSFAAPFFVPSIAIRLLILLALACPMGRAEAASTMMKFVLKALAQQSDVNGLDKRGYTLLHHVAAAGDRFAMKYLILKGASVDVLSKKEGITPLGYAALYGKSKAISYLLSKGANPKGRRGMTGWPPLYCAAASGDSVSAHLLVKAGAKANAPLYHKGKLTFLLDVALDKKDLRAGKLLLEMGAKPNVLNRMGNGIYPLLSRAISLGDPHLVKAMLEKKADTNAKNAEGVTALHLAAGSGRADLAYLLLAKGADRKARLGNSPSDVIVVRKGKMILVTPKGVKGTIPVILPALPKAVLGLTPAGLARRNGNASLATMIDRFRPGGRLPFLRSSRKLAKRVKTLLVTSRALGRVYEGRTYETGCPGHWPFRLQVGSTRGRSGRFDGWIEWLTLASKHQVEGTFRSGRLTFSETKAIRKGRALLGTRYSFKLTVAANPFPTHLQGTWKKGKRSGTVQMNLAARKAQRSGASSRKGRPKQRGR